MSGEKLTIVVATRNWHKFREIKWGLKDLKKFDLLSLNGLSHYLPPAPEELSVDLKTKAAQLAKHASQALGQWVLAEASSLSIPSLDKKLSSACCIESEQATADVQQCKELLMLMQSMTDLARSAHYECAIAIASPQGYFKVVSAYIEGSIADRERGNRGFGYDALFVKHDYDKTLAEIDDEVKNRVSHRAKALQKLVMVMESADFGKSQ